MSTSSIPRYFGEDPLIFPKATAFKMSSQTNGRDYEMLVSEPDGPAPSGGFPLVISLDADLTFFPLAHALKARAKSPLGVDECLLISIRFPMAEEGDPSRRYLEYTIPASPEQIPKHPKLGPHPKTGGAQEFLNFLTEELLPFLCTKIHINQNRTTLFGHSLAGFFTLFALRSSGNPFSSYVALSPSLWWANSVFIAAQTEWTGCLSKDNGKRLLVGVGANEPEELLSRTRKFDELMRHQNAGENYSYLEIADEDHGSVVHAFMSRVVAFALGPNIKRQKSSPIAKLLTR